MKKFSVWGSIAIDVEFEIEATSEKEAREIAKQRLTDYFHLDAVGGMQVPDSTDFSSLLIDEDD